LRKIDKDAGATLAFKRVHCLYFMTRRENILATIRRQPTDQTPWVPRLDLWYLAQRARGTLTARLRGHNTVELAEALDVACHSLRADFTLPPDLRDTMQVSFTPETGTSACGGRFPWAEGMDLCRSNRFWARFRAKLAPDD
jgi:hypothetical protein